MMKLPRPKQQQLLPTIVRARPNPAWRFVSQSKSRVQLTATYSSSVNPPASTRPAGIDIPGPLTPLATASDKLKRIIALGRAYVGFYKTGLKRVYRNYRACIPLRRSLGLSAYLPTSPSPARLATVQSTDLTRANFQLIHRAAHDVRRIVPFAITLIVCGELTPIVVLVLGNAVTPLTCRIPSQVAKERAQRSARKAAAVAASGSRVPFAVGSDQELDLLAGCYADVHWSVNASAEEVLRACAVLGLARSHKLVWLEGVYRRRLRRYAEYLRLDDRLIGENGVEKMEVEEVRIAVTERGGVDLGDRLKENELRMWLGKWLRRRRSLVNTE